MTTTHLRNLIGGLLLVAILPAFPLLFPVGLLAYAATRDGWSFFEVFERFFALPDRIARWLIPPEETP